jgi:integrase
MARRRSLTDAQVAKLPRPKHGRKNVTDPEMRGHILRVYPKGPIVFCAKVKSPIDGKVKWPKLGTSDMLKIAEAREECRKTIKRILDGLPAKDEQPDSIAAVANNWLVREVEEERFRSAKEYRRYVEDVITPHIGDRAFATFGRSDRRKFFDLIERKHSKSVAKHADAILSSIASWYEDGHDTYQSPFRQRRRKRKPGQGNGRDRVLDHGEVRELWRAADQAGEFGVLLQFLLLTGVRLNEARQIRWDEIDNAGVWSIKQIARGKGNAKWLPLS